MSAISRKPAAGHNTMKALLALCAALAMTPAPHAAPVAPAAAQARVMADGVVRRIDLANAKVTLRHGPIPNIDMPPMTMVYRVQPPSLLDGVKVGDTVTFHAEENGGAYVVTAIQTVR